MANQEIVKYTHEEKEFRNSFDRVTKQMNNLTISHLLKAIIERGWRCLGQYDVGFTHRCLSGNGGDVQVYSYEVSIRDIVGNNIILRGNCLEDTSGVIDSEMHRPSLCYIGGDGLVRKWQDIAKSSKAQREIATVARLINDKLESSGIQERVDEEDIETIENFAKRREESFEKNSEKAQSSGTQQDMTLHASASIAFADADSKASESVCSAPAISVPKVSARVIKAKNISR